MTAVAERIYVTPADAALAADVTVATLRQWVRRGHIGAPVAGLYDLDEIEAHSAARDSDPARFGRALAARRRRVACASDRRLSR